MIVKKTMYLSMKNLSEYICLSTSTDFNTIWKEWSERYKPLEETIPDLKKLGEQLCKIDKKEIKNVPERGYREVIKKMLKPEINKEELLDDRYDTNGN